MKPFVILRALRGFMGSFSHEAWPENEHIITVDFPRWLQGASQANFQTIRSVGWHHETYRIASVHALRPTFHPFPPAVTSSSSSAMF